jgi:hypothetical protein
MWILINRCGLRGLRLIEVGVEGVVEIEGGFDQEGFCGEVSFGDRE